MFKWFNKMTDKAAESFNDFTDKASSAICGYIYLSNKDNHVKLNIYERRLAICKKCSNFDNGNCLLCGCKMKYKAKLKDEKMGKCPDKPPKW